MADANPRLDIGGGIRFSPIEPYQVRPYMVLPAREGTQNGKFVVVALAVVAGFETEQAANEYKDQADTFAFYIGDKK